MGRIITMTNKAILREIHRDNKAINRNLQRLANIGLIGMAIMTMTDTTGMAIMPME